MNRDYKLYVHIAPNGKKYYGITKQDVKKRWGYGYGYSRNQYFYKAINKYGWNNIEHIVLHEGLDKEEAQELEQYMIQWYNTANSEYGYNQSLGGEGGNGRHYTHTEEVKQKISKANKGHRHTEEAKQKISKNNAKYYLGKTLPEETKRKIGEANKGKQFTEEHKKKISEANKGKHTGKDNGTARSIICITTNKVFDTITDGGNYYNINIGNLQSCCAGRQKSCGKLPDGTKLVWKYISIIEL